MLLKNQRHTHLILGSVFFILVASAFISLIAIGADLINPRAEFWRGVRHGVAGYTSVSSEGHSVLIQNYGESWREMRNVLLIKISPWVMGSILAILGVFHLIVGGDKLKEPRSGVMIPRYTLFERIVHWYTALFFLILAITGISLLLGRVALIPILGHGPFAAYLSVAKLLHNFSGPLFLVGVFFEFVLWVRFNFIHKSDLLWLKNGAGMIGSAPHVPCGKNNGGEKIWFWTIAVFGTVVGITGILLDFPIWGQSRFTMQAAHVVHTIVAVLFVTFSFVHMYMGSIGSQGAFDSMWKGEVDASWAKQHSKLWYDEVTQDKK